MNVCVKVFEQYFNQNKKSEKYSESYSHMQIVKDIDENKLIITLFSRWDSSYDKIIDVKV